MTLAAECRLMSTLESEEEEEEESFGYTSRRRFSTEAKLLAKQSRQTCADRFHSATLVSAGKRTGVRKRFWHRRFRLPWHWADRTAREFVFSCIGMKFKRNTRSRKPKLFKGSLLVKTVSERRLRNGSYDMNVLKRVLKNLSKLGGRKERPSKPYCQFERLKERKVDDEIRLRCRQLPSVVQELRKAVMRQDWDEVTTLLIVLCHPGLKRYNTIIMKVCFILLFSHPNSSDTLLQNFVRHATEYILDEDVNKFIRVLFALRKSALIPLTSGKYIRRTGDYKVTRDPEFEEL